MKRSLKIVLSYFLCILTVFAFPFSVLGADNDDFDVSIVVGGVSVDKYKSNETTVTIPKTINGKKVVAVSDDAFADNTDIEKIIISENTEKIGNGAFSGCSNLSEVDFGSVKTIGSYAFENCTKLDNVKISDCSIGYGAFINCTSLENIEFDKIRSMGRYALENTKYLNGYGENTVYAGNALVVCKETGDVVIENGATVIADGAFLGSSVTSVFIADTVEYIGEFAFADCKNLEKLTIPSTVKSIGSYGVGYVNSQESGYVVDGDFTVYCAEGAYAEQYCTDNSVKYEITDGCTHDKVKKYIMTKTADCLNDGEFVYVCERCHYTDIQVIPAKGHSFGEWEDCSELTCTTDHIQKRVCSVCKTEETQTVEKSEGHKWSSWSVAKNESCVEAGELQRICTVCEAVDSKIIPATEHIYSQWTVTVEPTCISEGERQCYCEACGDNKTEILPKSEEHQWGEWTVVKKATSTEKGEKSRECSLCKATETVETEYVDVANKLVAVVGSTIELNEDKHIASVKNSMTVRELKSQFEAYEENKILVLNMITRDMIDDGGNIVTGYAVVLVKDNDIVDYYYIALLGDGDGNGKVTTADARIVLRAVAKLVTVEDAFAEAVDVNRDGNINTKDARKILRAVAKLEEL